MLTAVIIRWKIQFLLQHKPSVLKPRLCTEEQSFQTDSRRGRFLKHELKL